ncbi:hypothetical protein AYO08_23360 [Pseudomonas putida]|nr:hypothetical protein AYO08_23360 [Pseudomonas putida]
MRYFVWLKLDEQVYRRLHNTTLVPPNGTTQIDHAFISVVQDRNAGQRHPRQQIHSQSGNKAGQQFWGCPAFPKCRIMQSL